MNNPYSADPLRCRYLRVKSMFIPGLAETEAAGLAGQPAHFWCNRTLCEVGPDDRRVSPERCRPGRACCDLT